MATSVTKWLLKVVKNFVSATVVAYRLQNLPISAPLLAGFKLMTRLAKSQSCGRANVRFSTSVCLVILKLHEKNVKFRGHKFSLVLMS